MPTSDSGRWAEIEALFHQAVARPAAERQGFLDKACEGDPELRRAVEGLLDADDGADDFLTTPAARVRGGWYGPDRRHRIGPYRLIRPIGAGGMGEVFLGLDEGPDYKRYVAIKVARIGGGPDAVDRFARERAILAQLQHPGIARFLAAGSTDEGRPYVAMEYVEGERIDAYADRNRLTIRERVELFQRVCVAVQHAHASLVVHRDLKPDNVLVTADGSPKLLDFGIAKLLEDDRSDLTRTGLRLATPAYAAPEQLRGEVVGTAADVYALGAILYEVLAGRRPFSAATLSARAGGDTTPSPVPPSAQATSGLRSGDSVLTAEDIGARRGLAPAALQRVLRSELDNIVLKAMDPEPSRRYVSAAALGDDLDRYLKGEPVRARPPSLPYRASKFVQRHRVPVAMTVLLGLALAGSTVTTLVQNRRIQAQAAQLESDRDRAREVQGFLLESFGGAGSDDAVGDTLTVREVLDARGRRIDDLYSDAPVIRGEMLHVLADGYERLGVLDEARRFAERAVEERRRIAAGEHDRDLASSLALLGWIRHQQGEVELAETTLRESVDSWRAIAADSAGLARALNDLCGVVTTLGRAEEAEALCREAMAIRRAVYPPEHPSIAITANNLGNALGIQGEREESLEWAIEAARILDSALGPRHRRTLFARRNVAVGYAWLGDWERSARTARDVADGFEELGGPLDIDLAWALESYGSALGRLGRFDEADSVLTRAHGIASQRLGAHPLTAYLLDQRRGLLQRAGREEEALPLARESVALYDRLYAGDHHDRARALRGLGGLTPDPEEAVQSYRAALDILTRLDGEAGRETVTVTLDLARALLLDQRASEALALFESLEETVPGALGPETTQGAAPYLGQAHAHAALGNQTAAETALQEARMRLVGPGDTAENRLWLAEVTALLSR